MKTLKNINPLDLNIKVDETLNKYSDQPVFEDKLIKINEILKKSKLPETKKLKN